MKIASVFHTIDNPGIILPSSCVPLNGFHFNAVTEAEIVRHVRNIKSNAVGYDGLSIKFIKIILPFILPCLTHIFNFCITTSTFPDALKCAIITPVAKKRSASEPCDFRPISILPAIAKVFESIISEQITSYLERFHLLSPLQSGFRKGHSCTTAMLKIIEDIRVPFDTKQLTLLCLLDFSKAFDLVDHNILCCKLVNYFHFTHSSAKLLASYLTGRAQCVKSMGDCSSFTACTSGVPQGSVLGPLLFSMFINDIFSLCRSVKVHAYADYVQLYISGDPETASVLATKLNDDLAIICNWAKENRLLLNVNKCKILPIAIRPGSVDVRNKVFIGAKALETIHVVKNLGFYINSRLTCTDHINHVLAKVYSILRLLRISSAFTPQATKVHLVKQLIMPHINYFINVFSKYDHVNKQKLIVAVNNAVRYAFGLRKYDHVSEYCRLLLGYSLPRYIELRNLLFLHSLLASRRPDYLYSKLVHFQSTRIRRLVIPRYFHLNVGRFFFVNTVRLWNSLPSYITCINQIGAFKTALHNYYSMSLV